MVNGIASRAHGRSAIDGFGKTVRDLATGSAGRAHVIAAADKRALPAHSVKENIVSILRLMGVSAGLLLLAEACRDGVAPRPALPHAVRFVQWANGTLPRFTTIGAASNGQPTAAGPHRLRANAVLSLNRYTASFWAVRGQARSVQINYLSATGDTSQPFVLLTTTDPDSVPGVGALAIGDSVLVTLTVDTARIGVSLEPTGLQFGTPAQFQIWYTGANGDFDGDGTVDSVDARIEAQLLGIGYRESPADPWTPFAATHSLVDQSFTAALPHFSDWAVSW
jgi:hypothetical protein